MVWVISILHTTERKGNGFASGQTQEAWNLVSKLEISSIKILLLKRFKKKHTAMRTCYFYLSNEILSHTFIPCVSVSQHVLPWQGNTFTVLIHRNFTFHILQSRAENFTWRLHTDIRSQRAEKHLQILLNSKKNSTFKIKQRLKISLTRHLAHL